MLGFGFRRDLPPLCGVTPEEMARAHRTASLTTPMLAGVRWLAGLFSRDSRQDRPSP
jgi:hypothetical protein